MIELFFALVGSKWIRRLGICLVAVSAYAWWDARTQNKGAERVIVKVNIDAGKKIEQAEKARTRVDGVVDPVGELRKRTCPGC